MAILESTDLLIQDALFRAGEVSGASEWDEKALHYINREYRALCAGASEFLPEYITDWWWMRGNGILSIQPIYDAGLIEVTQNSPAITFTDAPSISVTGWYFKTEDHPDVFVISSHTAGQATATLDMAYTGPGGDLKFQTAKLMYDLGVSVQAIMSPIRSFRDNPHIIGLPPERMDILYPIGRTPLAGTPQAFSLENENIIRFSHGGRTDGMSMRMEFRFRPAVSDLANSSSSIPLIPLQFRHVLSDMVLVYLYMDKNDDRMAAIGTSVRSALGAMVRENKRRHIKMDNRFGKILPRTASRRQRDWSGAGGYSSSDGDIEVLTP